MSRKPLKASKAGGLVKARDRITQKMSRDGVALCNETTGEDIRVSNRETGQDLREGRTGGETSYQLDKRSSASSSNSKNKQKQRQIAEHSQTAKNTADTGVQPQTVTADTPIQVNTPIVTQSETEHEELRREQPINRNGAKPIDTRRIPQKAAPFKSKPPSVVDKTPIVTEQTTTQLKHEDSGKLQFEHDNQTEPEGQRRQKPPQKHRPETTNETDNTAPDSSPPTERTADEPTSALKHDATDKLHFEPQGTEVKPQGGKPKNRPASRKATAEVSDGTTTPVTTTPPAIPQSDTAEKPAEPPKQNADGADSPLHSEKAEAPLRTDRAETPLKPDKSGKLQFAEDETPLSRAETKAQRKYGKAQKQTDKAAGKLDTAKSNLPAKKKLRSERVFNEQTGKSKRKLYFESEVKSQGEHLKGALPLRPVKAAGNSALAFGHRKMFQVERENVATEAAHKGEMFAEGGVRAALRHHKTAPYRKVAKLERKVRKKSINLSYRKAIAENPKLKSNPLARAFQKRKIKKDYAKAAQEAQKAAKRAKQAGSAVGKATKALAGIVKRHPVAAAVIVLILLLLFCLMSLIGAFGGMGSGGLGGILSASYLAEDIDVDDAEVAYTEWEVDLQEQIANAESTYAGYDEYRYNVGEISHNPYELMAYLTVKYQNFTYAAIEADLRSIFAEQYSLTFTPSVEIRYADPNDANEDGDYEPYEWNVLTVSLTASMFTDVVSSRLSGDEMAHYVLLLQTKGSRQFVGNPFGTDWLAYVTSYYGYRIHPISGTKDLHRGVDIGFPTGTQIHSAQDGTVTFADYSGDYGNVVVIENENGIVTKYAHCETLLVSAGQTVSMGDIIATVGSTGNSTGPHLHFEVLKNGVYLNPIYFADTGSFNLAPSYGYAGAPMGDGSYAALLAEAERFLNFPYVWGGSSPETSFDCSGYISFILRSSGVKDVGRLGAQGLYNICTPVSPSEARPGDLIFYHSTYSAPLPVTHVGLYVGTDATGRPRMIHCGSPIQYAYIDTAYWQNHFYAFGRVGSD